MVGILFFKEFNLLADILKSGQHLDQLHIVSCRDRLRHIGRYDRLNKRRVLRHRSHCRALSQDIFRNQHTGHISGEGHIFACLRILAIYAQTVRIGICCKNDVSVNLFCKF